MFNTEAGIIKGGYKNRINQTKKDQPIKRGSKEKYSILIKGLCQVSGMWNSRIAKKEFKYSRVDLPQPRRWLMQRVSGGLEQVPSYKERREKLPEGARYHFMKL